MRIRILRSVKEGKNFITASVNDAGNQTVECFIGEVYTTRQVSAHAMEILVKAGFAEWVNGPSETADAEPEETKEEPRRGPGRPRKG